MKLLKADAEHLSFQLDEAQKSVLAVLLSFYPLVPAAHQQLSRTHENPDAQKLLEEAMAAQHAENKSHVERFLKAITSTGENEYTLSLPRTQVEWFLQVLNDVHVGSWILLGSPEDNSKMFETMKNPALHRYVWAREVSQIFTYQVLLALEHESPPAKE